MWEPNLSSAPPVPALGGLDPVNGAARAFSGEVDPVHRRDALGAKIRTDPLNENGPTITKHRSQREALPCDVFEAIAGGPLQGAS